MQHAVDSIRVCRLQSRESGDDRDHLVSFSNETIESNHDALPILTFDLAIRDDLAERLPPIASCSLVQLQLITLLASKLGGILIDNNKIDHWCT